MDSGVSGTKDRRPALDALMKDAKRRRFDVLVVCGCDRLGRNLKHLVTLLEDIQAIGVLFVSLGEGIDCTTAAGTTDLQQTAHLSVRDAAGALGVSRSVVHSARLSQKPLDRNSLISSESRLYLKRL